MGGRKEVRGATESSIAIRKSGVVKCPSIDIAYVDDAVDYHLIAKIADLWPRPAGGEWGGPDRGAAD
jgi:hypothetical protein